MAESTEYRNVQQLILLREFCQFTSELNQTTNYPEDYQMVGGFDALANLLHQYAEWSNRGGVTARFVGEAETHEYVNIYALGAELFRRLLNGELDA